MMEEGRLRRVGRGVDVRSICECIENPKRVNFTARAKNMGVRSMLNLDGVFKKRAGKE